jgi:quinol monooxygenase YgiN
MGDRAMFGLIGKLRAVPGKRDQLAAILAEGTGTMPGCRSYVVALDPDEPDALWITEVWDDEKAHRASLDLPAVRDAITRGRPLIAGFDLHQTTLPVSGA